MTNCVALKQTNLSTNNLTISEFTFKIRSTEILPLPDRIN